MWTRTDYEKAAETVGKDFVISNGETSINDLSLKIAQDQGLNPEGIRTLVRLANVAAWEQKFEKLSTAKAEDRSVDFELGDPEIVISKLQADVKEAQVQEKTASMYNRTTDYYGDIIYERPPMEKTAGVTLQGPPEKTVPRQEVIGLLKRAEDKMREDLGAARYRWMSSLEKAAKLLVATDSRITTRTAFEKDAASMLGETILPELRMVHSLTSPKGTDVNLFGGEKVATVVATHIASVLPEQRPIIDLLKLANESRELSHLKETGLKWLEENRLQVTR